MIEVYTTISKSNENAGATNLFKVDEINEEPIKMLSNVKNVSDTPNKSVKVSHKYLKQSKSSKEIEDKSQDVF